MSNLTPYINEMNCEMVKEMIQLKKGDKPLTVSKAAVGFVQTDMDNFPYNRFYRGVYNFYDPVIFEREAGFRPVLNGCYQPLPCPYPTLDPDVNFSPPCTSVTKTNKIVSENLGML